MAPAANDLLLSRRPWRWGWSFKKKTPSLPSFCGDLHFNGRRSAANPGYDHISR